MNKLEEFVINCILLLTMFICSVAASFCLMNLTFEEKSLADFSVEVEVMCE